MAKGKTLFRSGGVGLLATGIDLAVLACLSRAGGLAPEIASAPALLAGIATQFVGNKLFAFRNRSPQWAVQGAFFLTVELGGFLLNLLLFRFAIRNTHLPLIAVRLATTQAVYFGFCFPLWRFIFRNRDYRHLSQTSASASEGQKANASASSFGFAPTMPGGGTARDGGARS